VCGITAMAVVNRLPGIFEFIGCLST